MVDFAPTSAPRARPQNHAAADEQRGPQHEEHFRTDVGEPWACSQGSQAGEQF